jgi:hypothetical protein
MALIIGDETANTGMSKAIYDELWSVLKPAPEHPPSDDPLEALQERLKKMAYAIAKGVIEHIKANMEIGGIQTHGNINAPVQGNTNPVNNHQHGVTLAAVQNNASFTQSNDGAGHVK